jgi:hypothetical protein
MVVVKVEVDLAVVRVVVLLLVQIMEPEHLARDMLEVVVRVVMIVVEVVVLEVLVVMGLNFRTLFQVMGQMVFLLVYQVLLLITLLAAEVVVLVVLLLVVVVLVVVVLVVVSLQVVLLPLGTVQEVVVLEVMLVPAGRVLTVLSLSLHQSELSLLLLLRGVHIPNQEEMIFGLSLQVEHGHRQQIPHLSPPSVLPPVHLKSVLP